MNHEEGAENRLDQHIRDDIKWVPLAISGMGWPGTFIQLTEARQETCLILMLRCWHMNWWYHNVQIYAVLRSVLVIHFH